MMRKTWKRRKPAKQINSVRQFLHFIEFVKNIKRELFYYLIFIECNSSKAIQCPRLDGCAFWFVFNCSSFLTSFYCYIIYMYAKLVLFVVNRLVKDLTQFWGKNIIYESFNMSQCSWIMIEIVFFLRMEKRKQNATFLRFRTRYCQTKNINLLLPKFCAG